MTGTGPLARAVDGWRPPPLEVRDRIGPGPVVAFAALLDVPAPPHATGDPLPPLWHWFSFLDHPPQSALGADGHPAAGHFLPPIPDRRRMIAGGRVRLAAPLRVGDLVTRRSGVERVAVKQGRSGEMVFVTVRHELSRSGEPLLVEEQDVVYRQQAAGAARAVVRPPAADPAPDAGAWQLSTTPDPVVLFRFSALTANAHRIHYDSDYARGVEGYPGLVVHGPLLALLLLELPRRYVPQRRVAEVAYRLSSPVFAGDDVALSGRDDGSHAALTARAGTGPAAVTADVRFAPDAARPPAPERQDAP